MKKQEIESVKKFKKSVLDPLISVNANDIITKPNCKLCNSPLRLDAEVFWEENEFNKAKTLRWLNERVDDHNIDLEEDEDDLKMDYFSIINVKSHMDNHFKEQERQVRLRNYAENIESLLQAKKAKGDVLDFALAACQENLARMASVDTYGTLKGEKERSDGVNKCINQMLAVIKAQGEMEGELNAIDLVQEKVAQIWIQMIGEEENEAKKRIYVDMLESFSEKFKELDADG
jgi:hypothetical protein